MSHEEVQKDNRIVTGSSWMAMGSMVSRILGAIYIIPWMAWMGTQDQANAAHALYQVGYNPYALFLAFATAGVPSAISKQISHYNAIQEYEISKKIYKHGLILMAITGILSAGIMYLIAPALAASSPADNESATLVIRSLAPALLMIPTLSVTRGLFQGHNRMREPAISQIVEQVARVIFILGATYIIRMAMSGEVVTAVTYSTFAAFVGAVFALVYLFYRIRQTPTALNREPEESLNQYSISTTELLKEIIKTSIPFVVISSGLMIFQQIDQQTYAPLMEFFYPERTQQQIQITYGIMGGNAHKLSTIITSFGAALAITSVPVMSDLMAKRKIKDVSYQFEQAVQLLMFIMIPAIIGMFVVSGRFYTFFYGYDSFGFYVTKVYAVASLLMGLYMVLGNILQAIDLRRLGIYALLAGIGMKLISQPIFIRLIGESGILYSTITGLALTIYLMFLIMYKKVGFSVKFLSRRVLLVFILSVIMGLTAAGVNGAISLVVSESSRLQSLIALLIVGVVGVAVYGYLSLKTGLAEKVVGSQATRLKEKLRIK
ncbi:MAG TPA: polysaccharide biosynthesis protein [Atopostipes sp.]|nr:polysaccharide biosynthesis protein [Atopostipes sp.]